MSAWPYADWTPTGIYSPGWTCPPVAIPWSWPVLDAREHGVAGDGMTDDTEPFTRLLETAVASPGSFVRIPRGIYPFDTEITVWVPSFVELPNQNLHEGDATSGPELRLFEETP